jgi:hypothetical protein
MFVRRHAHRAADRWERAGGGALACPLQHDVGDRREPRGDRRRHDDVRDALGNRPVDRRGATADASLGAARRACAVTEGRAALTAQTQALKRRSAAAILRMPVSDRSRFEDLSQSAKYRSIRARKLLILNGEMSEWLSAFAASPLRRDISP